MLVRSPFVHYSLVAATAAILAGLIYLQFSNNLPDSLQISNVKSLRTQHPDCALKRDEFTLNRFGIPKSVRF